ncbi:MAG: hypothetical protein IPF64_17620 [Flavobacteriales bacterium]|nr:hypothetical protein [Flavobacteriales bacterium]
MPTPVQVRDIGPFGGARTCLRHLARDLQQHYGVLAALNILVRDGAGWIAVEVKSSTRVRGKSWTPPEHARTPSSPAARATTFPSGAVMQAR